jgi:DNA-binding transcriptional LysR family regulator
MYAVKSGVGVGALPTAIADNENRALCAVGAHSAAGAKLAPLTHPDLRRTPRVAAFFDFIVEERDALKSILTG